MKYDIICVLELKGTSIFYIVCQGRIPEILSKEKLELFHGSCHQPDQQNTKKIKREREKKKGEEHYTWAF